MCTDAIETDTCTMIKTTQRKSFTEPRTALRAKEGKQPLSGVVLTTMRVLVEPLAGFNEGRMLVCKDALHHYEPSRQDGLSGHRSHSLSFQSLDRGFSVC